MECSKMSKTEYDLKAISYLYMIHNNADLLMLELMIKQNILQK